MPSPVTATMLPNCLSPNTRMNLSSGDARAIYKNSDFDFRYFKNLKMFVHAEKMFEADNLKDDDLSGEQISLL